MTIASRTATVKFIPKAGTYTAILMVPGGDLMQEYQGVSGSISSITPDFTKTKPLLGFIATSSRVAEGISVPTSIKWYFNGTKIDFGSNNISTTSINGETGHLQYIPYVAGSQEYFGIKIVKNLVNAAGLVPCTIKAIATIAYGTFIDEIQASYTIPIRKHTGNPYRITIAAGDNNYFTIKVKGGNAILKTLTYKGDDVLATGLTYKWFKMGTADWAELTGYTSQALTVTDAMVDAYTLFKVEVYQSGTLIGLDTQGVLDASDPYDILPNASPVDETIEDEGDTVVYTPRLVKRGETTVAKASKFFFVFTDSAGNVLNSATKGIASATGTVTFAMCQQAGDVLVVITTEN